MSSILIQIFIIILLIITSKDIMSRKRYGKWIIPIYLFVLYSEYRFYYDLLLLPENYFLKFLCGVTMVLLGNLCYFLIKYFNN